MMSVLGPPAGGGDAAPRRILTIDGGGIRGVYAIAILQRIESLLREKRGRPDLVLADEFDLFAGTSTGAIIAASLAWGMPVGVIDEMYAEHGRAMFSRSSLLRRIRARYRSDRIAELFKEVFREDDGTDATLGSNHLRRLLLVVMRNASTGSAWPLTNNPNAKFNDPALPDCNLNVDLWRLLRASTAAPTFFPPEQIDVGEQSHTFVDGGITPYNNPALLAFLTVTLPQYRIGWETGTDKLLVVSVGTGGGRARLPDKRVAKLHLLDLLTYMPVALLGSISEHQDMLCRVLGRCLCGEPIDAEIGDLHEPSLLAPERELFTYARYNQPLPSAVRMDDVSRMDDLRKMGVDTADAMVRLEHLFPD